jgi:phenylalanyl-tRNA synthetase alpha chain
MRWVDAYFPFTDPSLELEILYNGKWLEVLGCGVIQQKILDSSGLQGRVGWAFGLGLERLAMVLFDIPDIRLFWSKDERFLSQFQQGKINKFVPFSKYPPCPKDISFWIDESKFQDNDFFAIVRQTAGDCVENVTMISEFVHPQTKRKSKLFRITYRSLTRNLTNEEVNSWQENVRAALGSSPGIELR